MMHLVLEGAFLMAVGVVKYLTSSVHTDDNHGPFSYDLDVHSPPFHCIRNLNEMRLDLSQGNNYESA